MDIDIDLKPQDRTKLLKILADTTGLVEASQAQLGELKRHLVGVYFQPIPIDPQTNLAAIPYDRAQEFGYFKFDLLSLNMLSSISNRDELKRLISMEPHWELLRVPEVVSKLFHVSTQINVLKRTKPTSVLELADTLAIIRPNKIVLLDKYVEIKNSRDVGKMKEMRTLLYEKTAPSDLRKSHAIPYAQLIVAQLNLMVEKNEI